MTDSKSYDLSTYRFTGRDQEGLAPIDSFDNTIATSISTHAQIKQSVAYVYHPSSKQESLFPQGGNQSVQSLTWRLDPDESLSDWILTVVSNPELQCDSGGKEKDDDSDEEENPEDRDDKQPNFTSPDIKGRKQQNLPSTKYFVHRTQLAVGPRRSEYFAKLFRQLTITQKRSTTGTRIELRPSAAEAFPAMLDFIYSPVGTPPVVTTETAVALRHLSTCFGIRELFDYVTEFIKSDLSPETSPLYLLEADTYSHDKLRSAALNACAEYFESIKFSRIVTLTPSLLKEVILSTNLNASSRVLSSRVASYCRCRPGLVDAKMLQLLTRPDRMPEIAPEESLFFLNLISEVDEDCDEESVGGRRSGGKDSLYHRCLEASVDLMKMVIEQKSQGLNKKISTPARNAAKEYYSLPAAMKIDLLEYALSKSPSNHDHKLLEQAHLEAQRRNNEDSLLKFKEMKAEMERMQRKYEKKLASQEARIVAQEQEISAYAKELSRFIRVPNAFEIPESKIEYSYASNHEIDIYGQRIYGDVPPTALPRFGGRQGKDGWVFHERCRNKVGQRENCYWPVFVYKGDGSAS